MSALFAGGVLFTGAPDAARAQLVATGGVTTTYQSAGDPRIRNEATGSADLFLTWTHGDGAWKVHIEGDTTPRSGGVSTLLPEANAAAGTALDASGRGRVQVSEVNYRHALGPRRALTAGVLDPSSYFDQSRIASDENTQFLGLPFVQNPAIQFPGYTPGVVYEHGLLDGPVLRGAVTSSSGIGDNPQRSYRELADVRAAGKGVFVIASSTWTPAAGWLVRTGAWGSTADHTSLDGTHTDLRNFGAYLVLGYQAAPHGVNLRLGAANPEVSRTARFTGLTYQYRRAPYAIGAGAARIFLSDDEPDPRLRNATQYELYFRYAIMRWLFVTADVQHIVNSDFDATGSVHDRHVTVYGGRLTYLLN